MCSGVSYCSSFFNDPTSYLQAKQQESVDSQIDISLLAVGQQSTKQIGQAMASLVEAAAQLGKELGKGTQFDALA
jgi:hypothetical protein